MNNRILMLLEIGLALQLFILATSAYSAGYYFMVKLNTWMAIPSFFIACLCCFMIPNQVYLIALCAVQKGQDHAKQIAKGTEAIGQDVTQR